MNLNQLRIFHMAAREGNQSAAAEKLFISQPAVTKALNRLQRDQEVKLFSKDGNRLYLTPAGEELFGLADELFDLDKRADALLRDLRNEEESLLRIDASLTFGDYYMPELLGLYQEAKPEVKLAINVMPSPELIERTLKMRNDLAIISYPVENNNLMLKPLMTERLIIITPPDHRFHKFKYLLPKDLNGETIISHEVGSVQHGCLSELIEEHKLDVRLRGVTHTSNEAVKAAVECGRGIALISERAVARELRNGVFYGLPLGQPALKRSFYLIHHHDRILSPKIRHFIEVCNL